MARFRASIEGSSGSSAARLGSKVMTTITGWASGIEVHAAVEDGTDVFRLYATHGRTKTAAPRWLLGTVCLDVNGMLTFQPTLPKETA
jgi:hypothetical protein